MSDQSSRKRPIAAVTAALVLGAGAATLYSQLSPRAEAQAATPPATPAATSFNESRARTENERNTVDLVRTAQDGLVYISVSSGAQSATRQGGQSPNSQGGSGQGNNQGGGNQANPFAGTPFENLPFGQFGGGSGIPDTQTQPQRGTGSGFFATASGDILTNYHVVEGADTITIRVHNHPETYTAKVIGTAPDYDLALIRAEKLPKELIRAIPLGDSDGLAPGLKAVALGAPFGLDFSVTEGIISATGRKIPVGVRGVNQTVIQTDAAINPGNSGGPLLDSAGRVIGINTQILTGGSQQNAGVGFSIPVNVARTLLPKLQAGGTIATPVLGISYTDLSGLDSATRQQLNLPAQGALVGSVTPGSPAASAGLRAGTQRVTLDDGTPVVLGGDVITQVDGRAITSGNDLQGTIFGRSVGDTVRLTVLRSGTTQELSVKLVAFTPPASQSQ